MPSSSVIASDTIKLEIIFNMTTNACDGHKWFLSMFIWSKAHLAIFMDMQLWLFEWIFCQTVACS